MFAVQNGIERRSAADQGHDLAQCGRDEISLRAIKGGCSMASPWPTLQVSGLAGDSLWGGGFRTRPIPRTSSREVLPLRPGPLHGRSPSADAAHHARQGSRLRSNEFSPSWPLVHEPDEMARDDAHQFSTRGGSSGWGSTQEDLADTSWPPFTTTTTIPFGLRRPQHPNGAEGSDRALCAPKRRRAMESCTLRIRSRAIRPCGPRRCSGRGRGHMKPAVRSGARAEGSRF
jgi:hypothetical protein